MRSGRSFIIAPPDKRCFRCQPLRLYGRLQSLCSGHGDDNRMVAASPECLGKLVLIPQFANRKLPSPSKGAQPAFKPFHISQLRTKCDFHAEPPFLKRKIKKPDLPIGKSGNIIRVTSCQEKCNRLCLRRRFPV